MKRPRRGSVWLTLTPAELLAKLATLIPPAQEGLRDRRAGLPGVQRAAQDDRLHRRPRHREEDPRAPRARRNRSPAAGRARRPAVVRVDARLRRGRPRLRGLTGGRCEPPAGELVRPEVEFCCSSRPLWGHHSGGTIATPRVPYPARRSPTARVQLLERSLSVLPAQFIR